MARVSKTGKLISENEKLASLPKPFSDYYAYFRLGLHFSESFRDFFVKETDYIKSMFPNAPKQAFEPSEYLSPYDRQEVDIHTCQQLQDFLNKLMNLVESPADRRAIKQFDFGKVDGIMEASGFKYHALTYRRVQDFWLKARRCIHPNEKIEHMDTGFLDLLAAFCGYTNFKDYLRNAFGEDYQADTDPIYQALITGSAFNLQTNKIYNRKKQTETPRELVPNAVTEPRTDYFLGREESLVEITEQLRQNGSLLLHAEGGMGKTTVAAAYYHRSIRSQTYKNLAWLYCEQGTLKAIDEMAHFLGLPFQDLVEKDRLRMIQHKLKAMEDDFLLVLDNVEDDLGEFLMAFQGFNWQVLVTSRVRMKWEGISEYELPALSTPAAKALFKGHYRDASGGALESGAAFEALLDKLISAIGYNTLLIEVFAKQLREEFWGGERERFGLREFLERLEAEGLYLAESQEDIATNYAFYRRKSDLATTTDILDGLHDFSKLDTRLNSLLINLALLPKGDHRLEVLHELFQPGNKREFRSNLKKLYAKGWLGGDGAQVFRMSPVIQDLAINKHQEQLWEEGKGLVERVGFLIQKDPKKDDFHKTFKWQPIAGSLSLIFKDCMDPMYSRFLNSHGIFLKTINGEKNIARAVVELEKALALGIQHFGEEHLEVGMMRSNLATALIGVGKKESLSRALEESEKALDSGLKIEAEEAPSVAVMRSNRAMILYLVGGRDNQLLAVAELKKALRSDIANFGEDSPEAARCRSNLALALTELGGHENLACAAVELEKAVISGINHFGKNAPTVAIWRSNLGVVLNKLEGKANLSRAVGELERSLESNLINFGDFAPAVARSRSNLATILLTLSGKNNLLRAATELELALASYRKIFGEEADEIASVRSNLALTLQAIGGTTNLLRAVAELKKALASKLKNFGEDSPTVAVMRSNLALCYKGLGGRKNLLLAEAELTEAISSDLKNFGESSPAVERSRSNLALVRKDLGGRANLIRSADVLEQALKSYVKNFGADGPDAARYRSNLAVVYRELGGREYLMRALSELESALESCLRHYGEDFPSVAVLRANLAMVRQNIGGRENLLFASEQIQMALVSDVKNFGETAPVVAKHRSNLALVHQYLGGPENLQLAKMEFEKALVSYEKSYGVNAVPVSIVRSNLAMLLKEIGGEENLIRARIELERALSSYVENLGNEAPATATLRSNLAAVLQDIGGIENNIRAKGELKTALSLYEKRLGNDAPTVSVVRSNFGLLLRKLGGHENLKIAQRELERSLASNIKNFSSDAPQTVIPRLNLALVLYDLTGKKNLLEAKRLLLTASSIADLHLGETHQVRLTVKSWLKKVEDDLEKGE
ncbi:tetratricopeptide repeat protein [Cyclobacterium sp. SYSU L10401]|uniref:tetratricopeptide repeat protein n=1 Tax=Cyclobacterium sp. SYSU L10401 TaxID=2678657 RepID=UPI0013D5F5D8|nr:tetratricopeptide repeat protein [Cyclobacterium sp. SYSU L10401]